MQIPPCMDTKEEKESHIYVHAFAAEVSSGRDSGQQKQREP